MRWMDGQLANSFIIPFASVKASPVLSVRQEFRLEWFCVCPGVASISRVTGDVSLQRTLQMKFHSQGL